MIPFQDQVGVGVHQHPVLKGAGLHFVGIGDNVAGVALADEAPLLAGGKPGPAPALQLGVQHRLQHLFGRAFPHGVHEGLVTALGPVLVQGEGAVRPPVQ